MPITDRAIRDAMSASIPDKRIKIKINEPYSREHARNNRMTMVRNYDKEYRLGGLTVFAEAALGEVPDRYRVSSYDSNPNKTILATPQRMREFRVEEKEYLYSLPKPKEERDPLSGITLTDEKGKKHKFLETLKVTTIDPRYINHAFRDRTMGPVVDSAKDVKLETIRIRSALVQYDGTDLSGLDASWRKFISAVREKYHVNVTPPNRGAISTDAYGSDRHIYSAGEVFSKSIRKESDVWPRITSVWNAGTAVTKAINSKTELLIGRLT